MLEARKQGYPRRDAMEVIVGHGYALYIVGAPTQHRTYIIHPRTQSMTIAKCMCLRNAVIDLLHIYAFETRR
jgi:hypothetical protein